MEGSSGDAVAGGVRQRGAASSRCLRPSGGGLPKQVGSYISIALVPASVVHTHVAVFQEEAAVPECTEEHPPSRSSVRNQGGRFKSASGEK